ncbi:MAG: hydantoinase/oxoprolinase family protein [Acidimicrobiia bacterium]|nr:hydantoinase/oxoprolinase family protein [Acidimicrobiia bacterium]
MAARSSTGVDVGGTFTDVVAWDGERLATGKVPSTPDQSEGVVAGLASVAGPEPGALLHGTTVATNALLERRGARTALVTDAGFEDVVEIGRQDRPSLYDTAVTRTPPLVPRDLRFGIEGRARHEQPAAAGDLDELDAVVDAAPEAVAVSLLYAFESDDRERAVADRLRSLMPGVAVSRSSGVVAEFREFERTITTVVNAYLTPATSRYLDRLAERAADAGVAGEPVVMRSSGGLVPLATAAALPAAVLLSGPAGGVVAATALGDALGRDHLISFDMGGTSTDVCRIDHGRPEVGYERPVAGLPTRMPSVAIHTVGAGGGSVAWVDAGGALRVGPRSAGAVPGPACYGRGGTEAAVTDANVVLGRLAAGASLGGDLRLDEEAARSATARIGEQVDLDTDDAALGIVEIVEAHMHRAIRAVSIEEGADPRRAVLVAFGGAGGLHATALARRLEMEGVVVPPHAGVFSALGLLLAPPRSDAARSVLLRTGDARLDDAVGDIAAEARRAIEAAGGSAASVRTIVDARYLGQSHETAVLYEAGEGWEALEARFHDAHRTRNGFAREEDPVEVVTVRAEAVGPPALTWSSLPAVRPDGEPRRGTRPVRTASGTVEATVWWRPGLAPGSGIDGPAVIEEPEATTWLDAGERATVHESGALEVAW